MLESFNILRVPAIQAIFN